MTAAGQPPFPNLRYCLRCCMPETAERIAFDEMGVCTACRSSEQKMRINWTEREKELRKILEFYRERAGNNYDCLVPISGGKDSAFQLHVLIKVYGMKPLAVTFSHNWFSEAGKFNLQNILEKLNVDHLMFTPNRSLVNRLAKRSLYMIGDSCWHCHAGVGAFPLQAAVRFEIPLIVWGESVAEGPSGKATYEEPIKFDREYFLKVSSKVEASRMANEDISEREVGPFELPSLNDIQRVGVVGIHLGDYIFWDAERQVEFLKQEYGWREDEVEGTYKQYKSVECIMPGVHDYLKYLKRGFGRATDHASQDVRAGLITREEGFDLAKQFDQPRPKVMDYYLQITGLTEEEVVRVAKSKRQGKAEELP